LESAKKEKTYKVTKAQAKFFWRQFAIWCEFWGCDKLWEIHTQEVPEDNCYASIAAGYADGMAVVKLCTTWDVPVTKRQMDKVAFHESVHLFLAPISPTDNSNMGPEHQIVRVMENQIWYELSDYTDTVK
jgi:hypothetical protein